MHFAVYRGLVDGFTSDIDVVRELLTEDASASSLGDTPVFPLKISSMRLSLAIPKKERRRPKSSLQGPGVPVFNRRLGRRQCC